MQRVRYSVEVFNTSAPYLFATFILPASPLSGDASRVLQSQALCLLVLTPLQTHHYLSGVGADVHDCNEGLYTPGEVRHDTGLGDNNTTPQVAAVPTAQHAVADSTRVMNYQTLKQANYQ